MLKRISAIIFVFVLLFTTVGCNMTIQPGTGNKEYTVTFDSDGGNLIDEIKVGEGALVEEPAKPTKDGYVFLGWYQGKLEWNFESDTVTKNITLTAKWQEVQAGVEYTITFDTDGGSEVDSITVLSGNEVVAPSNPTKVGYTFKGWEPALPEVMPNENLEVKAVWEVKQYTIRFNTGSGSKIETLTLEYGANVSAPEDPTRNGYDFAGWDKEFPETMPAQNLTFTAKWEGQTKNITYVLNDGILEGEYPTEFKVGTSTKLVEPTRSGYAFEGWYYNSSFTGSAVRAIGPTVINDVTLYAKWTKEAEKVTYELNGGNWNYTSRDEIVEDFLKDAMAWGNKTSKPDGMVQGAGDTQVGFANVFSSQIYGIFSDPTYGPKWTWLKEYIIETTTNATSKSNLQKGEEAFWRYSIGAFLFKEYRSSYPISEDYSVDTVANGFWQTLSENDTKQFDIDGATATLTPVRIYYIFRGWYDNPEFTGEPVTTVSSPITLYAKWEEETPVESIVITNKITDIDRFDTYQVTWQLNPTNAAIKDVEFYSSDENIATVDAKGLITILNNGNVTITIKSLSPSGVTDSMTVTVTSPDYFDVSYETNSYVTVGNTIKLNADYVKRDGSKVNLLFASQNLDIASVDALGNVTGVKEGLATIRVQLEGDANTYFDFVVTVLPESLSAAQQYVVDQHESNVFERYDLGIGAGTPVYYADIFGSISKLLFDYDAVWNTEYLEACMANGQYTKNLEKVEFITVHYTAGMTEGSNAAATASYFSRAKDVSAHFCTGNDGIYQSLDLDVRGWHAGDGASSAFSWTNTGVKWNESDPQWPEWGISSNAMFTINGQETSIKVPKKEQNGNEGYVTDEKWLNDQGFAFKVVDGYYYMGTTWWCYSNVWEGRICSRGGNRYSIGIESAVDYGSDLWYTWQITAKLVAQLMVKYNLDITRVVGHHFFAAKDCPQPLLENDLEIWWEFIELVKAEYAAMTTFEDYTFELNIQNGTETINEHGRVTEQPEFSEVVTYEVVISNGTTTETVTLATIVPGQYTK